MAPGPLEREQLPDEPEQRTTLLSLEREIADTVGGALSPDLNGIHATDDIYFATSWLRQIYRWVRRQQGDTHHDDSYRWSDERLLAAICNRLDLSYEVMLNAGAFRQVEMLHQALLWDGGAGNAEVK